jgi:hypothetical protein
MVYNHSAAARYGRTRGESRRRRDSEPASVAFPNRREKGALSRAVLALCIIAALVMAAYKPARGASADTHACAPATAGNGTGSAEYCSRSAAFAFELD